MTDKDALKAYMLYVYSWRGEFDLGSDGLGDSALYHKLKPIMDEIVQDAAKAKNEIHNMGELHFIESCFA